VVCVHTAGPCSFHPQNSVALDATFKTEGQVEMLKSLKQAFTQETVSSIEPRVILPAWKSVIVDCLTIFTLGLCRWRWNGVTLSQCADKFQAIADASEDTSQKLKQFAKRRREVEFVCDASVHRDPRAMRMVQSMANVSGANIVKVESLPDVPVDAPSAVFRVPADDGSTESMVFGYVLDGVIGGESPQMVYRDEITSIHSEYPDDLSPGDCGCDCGDDS
jgi:hypothetical protein